MHALRSLCIPCSPSIGIGVLWCMYPSCVSLCNVLFVYVMCTYHCTSVLYMQVLLLLLQAVQLSHLMLQVLVNGNLESLQVFLSDYTSHMFRSDIPCHSIVISIHALIGHHGNA